MTRPHNLNAVFSVFKKNYVLVPLEVFGSNPYKTLVSTILSSRTKDEVTLLASNRLFEKAENFQKLSLVKEEEISKLIYPVGFYRTKAKNLVKLADLILNEFGGNVPQTRDELVKLPGVGRKTANLVLNRAFKKPAIAVDTHVHRICNTLGWVKTNSPEQTEIELNKIIPSKYMGEMNRLFVSIGRQYRTKRQLEKFLKENKLSKFE